jgi:hypothetical protein
MRRSELRKRPPSLILLMNSHDSFRPSAWVYVAACRSAPVSLDAVSTLNRKRSKGQLFCGLVFVLGGIVWGSDALRSEHHHTAFHIWSRGSLVTDSPKHGLIIAGIFICLGALLVALYVLSGPDKAS